MLIDVWSDVVCPWCFIGKRRLETALAESGVDAQVVHRAYQLDPNARTDGLRYRLSETTTGNTRDAHRLILWAATQGPGEALVEELFHRYFELARPVFSVEDLVPVAAAVGLDTVAAD